MPTLIWLQFLRPSPVSPSLDPLLIPKAQGGRVSLASKVQTDGGGGGEGGGGGGGVEKEPDDGGMRRRGSVHRVSQSVSPLTRLSKLQGRNRKLEKLLSGRDLFACVSFPHSFSCTKTLRWEVVKKRSHFSQRSLFWHVTLY